MEKYTWDYNPPKGSPYQEDWNQSLHTMLNMIYLEHKLEGNILVKSPVKFEPLFKSILFYNEDRHVIGDQYFIEFRDYDSDVVFVDSHELEILNFKE